MTPPDVNREHVDNQIKKLQAQISATVQQLTDLAPRAAEIHRTKEVGPDSYREFRSVFRNLKNLELELAEFQLMYELIRPKPGEVGINSGGDKGPDSTER